MLALALEAGAQRSRPAPAPRPRLRPLVLVAAALLLLATGAAAARWSEGKHLFGVPSSPASGETEPRLDPAREACSAPKGTDDGRGAAALPSDPPSAAPAPESVSARELAPTRSRPSGISLPSIAAPERAEAASAITPVTPPAVTFGATSGVVAPSSSPLPTAASLFDDANDARLQGNYGMAIALYRELDVRFADAPEAASAEVILGRLLLDRGDTAAALEQFDAYASRGSGPMQEEVLVGRATALRRLGNDAAEHAAWDRLLADFPGSVHAAEARARLALLGER
jgi:TolA-binding protein